MVPASKIAAQWNQRGARRFGVRVFFGLGAMAIPEQAKRCEQYARDCLRLAKQTSSARERELLVQMAETWRRLAEQAKGSGELNTDGV